jgi:hypothetical protein
MWPCFKERPRSRLRVRLQRYGKCLMALHLPQAARQPGFLEAQALGFVVPTRQNRRVGTRCVCRECVRRG